MKRITHYAPLAAKELIAAKPICRLEARDVKTTAAKLLLKDLDVCGREVHVTLGL